MAHALLTAFVCRHAPWPRVNPESGLPAERTPVQGGVADDVAAALAVLSRGKMVVGGNSSELERVDLRDAELREYNFPSACFNHSNLDGADLSDANLAGATLSDALLRKTDLSRADLTGADLTGADLTGLTLMGPNFSVLTLPMQSSPISASGAWSPTTPLHGRMGSPHISRGPETRCDRGMHISPPSPQLSGSYSRSANLGWTLAIRVTYGFPHQINLARVGTNHYERGMP